jgi:putative transposase
MERTRCNLSPEQKVNILREHLIERVPVSDVCDTHQIQPTLFYQCQETFFEKGSAAFEAGRSPSQVIGNQGRKFLALQSKLAMRSQALAELMEEHVRLKKSWGGLTGTWTPHDARNQVIDFIHKWGGDRSGLSQLQVVGWGGIARSKFYDWRTRYGKANGHNSWIPRDHWIDGWERDAIVKFAREFPLEGYRRLTFMMLDRDIVAVSSSTAYLVLKAIGLTQAWNGKPSKKGTGFVELLAPHEHWHVDVAYINVAGTFYYLCSLLDGCSRFIIHHELREAMTEAEVEINHPTRSGKAPWSQAGLNHAKTSPYYPRSNGKIERWHKSLKADCIRPATPLDIEQARRLIAGFLDNSNTVRLHSAIGYITPQNKLLGKEKAIFADRDQKLAQARLQRIINRQNQPAHSLTPLPAFSN